MGYSTFHPHLIPRLTHTRQIRYARGGRTYKMMWRRGTASNISGIATVLLESGKNRFDTGHRRDRVFA